VLNQKIGDLPGSATLSQSGWAAMTSRTIGSEKLRRRFPRAEVFPLGLRALRMADSRGGAKQSHGHNRP
jgi:hypothetical protein